MMFLLRTRSNKKFHGQYFSQGQTARHLLIHNLCMKSAWGVLDAIFFQILNWTNSSKENTTSEIELNCLICHIILNALFKTQGNQNELFHILHWFMSSPFKEQFQEHQTFWKASTWHVGSSKCYPMSLRYSNYI